MFTKDDGKHYTGTKIVRAWPCSRREYCLYRGWVVPETEGVNEPGYIVEYEPDEHPNHPNHDGYISWTPAKVFDRTYTEL
jgi:hypothetical protein